MPVHVLVDTGAGGGNYASESFVRSVERNVRGGQRMISSKGKGWLRAANPTQSGVPPMNIIGSCDIPLVFSPEDRVRRLTVRVVKGLPYGLILGAAFLRQNESVINFAEGGGFKPAPESPWVPLRSAGERLAHAPAAPMGSEETAWDRFCAVVPPPAVAEPEGLTEPAVVPGEGEVAWEDDGSLQWNLRMAKTVKVEGFVSVQTEAYVKGPQPQDRQLVLVVPTQSYDMEQGAELGIARGVQWWYPGNPLQCKVVNRSSRPIAIQQGLVVAKVYATNSSDTERMRLLLEKPAEEAPRREAGQQNAERQAGNGREDGTPGALAEEGVDLAEANMGQLSHRYKSDLLELLRVFRDRGLFPANPKVVPACRGAKLRLPLIKEDCTPHAA